MAMLNDWEEALVRECRAGRLATINSDGQPNLVPVCYALADGRFAIAIDEKPKQTQRLARIRNIERDPRVSLLIDRYEEDWRKLAWVRIVGEARVHERGEVWQEALDALRARYPQYQRMELEPLPLIDIRPLRIVSWRWDGGAA